MSFFYDKPYKEIFENINLEIDYKWKTVIVGKNGRGKSTLLKLIKGELKSQKGSIDAHRKFLYFPYEVEDKSIKVINLIKDIAGPYREYEKKIEEYLNLGSDEGLVKYGEVEEKYRSIGGYEVENRIEIELNKLNLSKELLGLSYETLSGGEKTKVQLLAFFINNNTFPLLDEPTNHLDILGRKVIAEYLSTKEGFICISHDSNFLNKIGDHIIDIDDKRGIKISKSKFSNYFEERNNMEKKEKEKNEELKKSIKAKIDSFDEKKSWSMNKEKEVCGAFDKGFVSARAARLMQKAKNVERRLSKEIEEKEELVKKFEKEYEIKFIHEKNLVKEILRVDNLNISYGDKQVINNLSFNLSEGERIAIIGKNGAGKSSILKKVNEGVEGVFLDKRMKYSLINQEIIYGKISLREHLYNEKIDYKEFGRFLASFDMRGEILERNLDEFSQGEKRKIALAKSIFSRAHFYLWDEPLNFLDYKEIEKLKKAILKYQPTMIFVEHNLDFVNSVATKIIEL